VLRATILFKIIQEDIPFILKEKKPCIDKAGQTIEYCCTETTLLATIYDRGALPYKIVENLRDMQLPHSKNDRKKVGKEKESLLSTKFVLQS